MARQVLIGRDGERDAIAQHLTAVSRQRGAVVIVEGEAGIGKSTLLADAIEQAADAGFFVLAGKADELASQVAFSTLASCLGLHRDADDRRAAVAAHLRGDGLPGGGDGGDALAQLEFRVGEATIAFIEDRSAAGPILLVVDDLHWADGSTLRTLLRVASVIPQLPVLLLCATRAAPRSPSVDSFLSDVSAMGVSMLRLGSLAPAAVPALVASITGAEPGPRLLEQLGTAGGNPLFLSVAVETLLAEDKLVVDGGVAELAEVVAPTLSKTILQRLRLCSDDTLDALRSASLLGGEFTASTLAAVRGQSITQLLPALRESLESGVLHERGDALAFRHDLIREALYQEVPASIRADLHLELARTLAAAGEAPSTVAAHLLRGATRPTPDTVALLHRTANASLARAPEVAVALLERAVDLARTEPALADAALADLAVALLYVGRFDEGVAVARRALAKGIAPSSGPSLRLRLAQAFSSRGLFLETLDETRDGLADPSTPTAEQAHLEGLAGMSLMIGGDVSGATEAATRAAELSDRAGQGVGRTRALGIFSLAARTEGRLLEGVAHAEASVASGERLGTFGALDHVPHVTLALVLHDVGRAADALAAARRGLELVEPTGSTDSIAWHHVVATQLLYSLGRWDEAEAEARVATGLTGGSDAHASIPHSFLARIALHRNDLDAAREHVRRTEGAPPLPGDVTPVVAAAVLEAEGRLDDAVELAVGACEFSVAVGMVAQLPYYAPEAVRLAVACGAADRVGPIVDALEAVADANPGVPMVAGAAARCRAQLEGDPDRAAAAVAHLRDTDRASDLAFALELAGELSAAAGRVDDAARDLAEAGRFFARVDAARCVARIAATERAIGVSRGTRRPRRRAKTGWEALTETEITVALLVAERLSNPEIAERLFISRRTVESHVSHALAKLGATSRRELGELARNA